MTPFSESSPRLPSESFEIYNENTRYHKKMSKKDSETQLSVLPFDLDNRFVAGAKFFNYEHLGALREGGEVSLFSKDQHGILAAMFASNLAYGMLGYCLRPALPRSLGFHFDEPPFGPFFLTILPLSLCFFFGMLSDSVPIANYRRKPYMIIGIVIAALALISLAALSTTVNAKTLSSKYTASHLLYLFMSLMVVCVAGIVLVKVSTEARIIELSQREPLRIRGTILINYLLLRTLVECICTWISAALLRYNALTNDFATRIHSGWIYGILCIICLAVIPIIVYRTGEDAVNGTDCDNRLSNADSINIRGQKLKRFFRMCHQRAVWQLALFLTFAIITARFKFSNASSVIAHLVNPKITAMIYIAGGRAAMSFMVMLAWKIWWMNSSWRRFVLCGFLLAVLLDLIQSLLVLHVRAMRNEIFFYCVQTLSGITEAIHYIYTLVPAVELAELGLEGATSGLFSSFCCIISTTMCAICRKMNSDVSTLVSVSPRTVLKVTLLMCILALVNGLSAATVLLLPHQRLDAQQIRAFGGYTRSAPTVLFLIYFGMLFVALGLGINFIVELVRTSLAK
ncbi:unnamed protein product [Albugo candida]|uniref:Transmembrane protein n=1 Tax=Albugo candida TaxID=65357 RepID=A0A024G3G1_9STRA|nr:unnamed protein product [Albugo candida]|eukprot:CCI40839.1 unnamed protein product [Albugo candida]